MTGWGVADGVAAAVGEGVGAAVGDGVAVATCEGVGAAVGDGVAVAVCEGVGIGVTSGMGPGRAVDGAVEMGCGSVATRVGAGLSLQAFKIMATAKASRRPTRRLIRMSIDPSLNTRGRTSSDSMLIRARS